MISIGVEEPISCFGADDGELRATASGGTGSLDYSWSNGDNVPIANNLSAGNYIVTVTDDNNCFDTKDFTISEPAQVPATITTDPSPAEICLNDEIELRANTGAVSFGSQHHAAGRDCTDPTRRSGFGQPARPTVLADRSETDAGRSIDQ